MHSARFALVSRRPCRRFFATAVLLLAATMPVPARQQPAQKPTYRVQVNLVQVDVFVTDAQGHFVPDLTKDDFELLEDGKVQPLTTFAVVNLPVATTDPPAIPDPAAVVPARPRPDVATNAGLTEPRVYILMLDDLQTALDDSVRVRVAALRFIDAYLQPGDVAAVLHSSGRGDVSAALTGDRVRLRKSIESFIGSGLPAAGMTTARMRAVSDYLAGISGRRKACIYFGPGFSTGKRPIPLGPPKIGETTPGALGTGNAAGGLETPDLGILDEVQYRDLVASANRGNVSFYTMDVRGVAALANLVSADQRGVAGAEESGAKTTNAGGAKDRLDTLHDGRLSLPADTGGVAALTRDVDPFFRQVQLESSSYYMLGYQTSSTAKASLRKIAVRSRRPGLTLRARRQFWWPGTSTAFSLPALDARNVPPVLVSALQYPLHQSDIRFAAAAIPFKGTSGTGAWASVIIEIDGRDVDASGHGTVDVAVVAVNASGAVKGSDARRLDLGLDADGLARIQKNGLRVQARVPVPADACVMRIAVADAATGRVGSLWLDVDVPDFSKPSLTMSGLALTHREAALSPTANADQELRKLMPAPISTRREFTPRDTILWLAEIYPSSESLADLRVTTTIVGVAGSEVFRRERPLARDPSKTLRVTYSTDLSRFAPGSYVLRIEVQAVGDPLVVRRETTFRVAGSIP